MTIRHVLLTLSLAAVLSFAPAAWAGGIFGKHGKGKPAERVPELVGILRSDPDERKRESAAKELRDADATAFPDVVPALVEALLSDVKPAVRVEAAESLGKLRPVNPTAGHALEQAQANDASMRVRLQARRILLAYRLGGYRSQGKTEEKAAANPGPALTAPAAPQAKPWFAPPAPRAKAGNVPAETGAPPLAPPAREVLPLQPVPQRGAPLPPPVRTGDGQGPALGPPN